jgi:hypothetical protein
MRNVELPRMLSVWEATSPRAYSIEVEFKPGDEYYINVIITDRKQRQQTCGVPAEVMKREKPHPRPDNPAGSDASPILIILVVIITL